MGLLISSDALEDTQDNNAFRREHDLIKGHLD